MKITNINDIAPGQFLTFKPKDCSRALFKITKIEITENKFYTRPVKKLIGVYLYPDNQDSSYITGVFENPDIFDEVFTSLDEIMDLYVEEFI